uniref:Transporter n=1 Tax=Bracon brevicornis TaxID=1563983 RepID=A0A6V7M2F4_9HYME
MEPNSSTEDEDLIDLETGVHLTNNPNNGAEFIEQEHLLDVCPPKLEQKLSSTSEAESLQQNDCPENDDDTLLTFGHEQVIPAQKRIDVVSSETIKRVRNITKNLEPVLTSMAQSSESKSDNAADQVFPYYHQQNTSSECASDLEPTDRDDNLSRVLNETKNDNDIIMQLADDSHQSITSRSTDNDARSEIISEGSEVDWSWIKEAEQNETEYSSCCSSHLSTVTENKCKFVDESCQIEQICERYEEEEPKPEEECRGCSIEIASSNSVSSSVYEVSQQANVNQFVESAPPTATAAAVEPTSAVISTNQNEPSTNDNEGERISWIRASMRRLRHLRLPETDRNRRVVSTTMCRESTGPNSLPDIASIAPEILAIHTNSSDSGLRPSSAPAARSSDQITSRGGRRNNANTSLTNRSNTSRSNSSNNSTSTTNSNSNSLSTVASSSASQHYYSASDANVMNQCSTRRRESISVDARNTSVTSNTESSIDSTNSSTNEWPHGLSPALACLGCTLGLFNISRFAILSVHFGANFILQFLLLTLVLGIPLFTLQMCLGQRLNAGTVGMWKISPIFSGVGIAILIVQALIGIYSIIGVSWMLIYFKDSFITKQERYKWAEPLYLYRDTVQFFDINNDNSHNNHNNDNTNNNSLPFNLHETVPDYFNGVVLERYHNYYYHNHHNHDLDHDHGQHHNQHESNETSPVKLMTIKLQVAINLALIWIIIFLILSKGLRTYGKIVFLFTLIPIFSTLVFCTKFLASTPAGMMGQIFPATYWNEFFINNRSWLAAASEVFLTWGLFGAAIMQITAHNKHKNLLQRDASIVIVITILILLLVALVANTCVQILKNEGYIYTASSFEIVSQYENVHRPSSSFTNTPERFMSHSSFLIGQRIIRPGADPNLESGYQALRFPTEIVPAALAILGTDQISSSWTVTFYTILIMFGISQQLAIWNCVISGIMTINVEFMKKWQTTVTFVSCTCAYLLGLPMATEFGIYIIYYLDYTIGGAWWIIILYFAQIIIVFAVRGRPHTGEAVVGELFPPTGRCLMHWAGPLLSFTWNLILPVGLMVLSIIIFKGGNYKDFYTYKKMSRDYWPVWARQTATIIQIIPIMLIPIVAFVQTYRYLKSGPADIFDRIQLLYRPPLDGDTQTNPSNRQAFPSPCRHANRNNNHNNNNNRPLASTDLSATSIVVRNAQNLSAEDPPPKYTPPPSYTTATGARIAKILRQSFRRSIRRIVNRLGESSSRQTLQLPPPDYSTISVEMNMETIPSAPRQDILVNDSEITTPANLVDDTSITIIDDNNVDDGCGTSGDGPRPIIKTLATIQRTGKSHSEVGSSSASSCNITAADVANLLRSSIRRGTASVINYSLPAVQNDDNSLNITATSTDNLVNAVAPIGQENALVLDNERIGNDNNQS